MKLEKNEYLLAGSAASLTSLMVPIYEVQGIIIACFVFLVVFLMEEKVFSQNENGKSDITLNRTAVILSTMITLYFMAYFLAHEKGSGVPLRKLSVYAVVFGLGSLYFVLKLFGIAYFENVIAEKYDGLLASKKYLYACYGLTFLMLIVVIAAAFRADVWDDEMCSLITASNSYHDLVRITALDVHPPLYYIILKFLSELLIYILPVKSYAIAGKLVSVLPVVLLLLYNRFSIRRKYGQQVEGYFALFIAGTFQIMLYSIEIRMYSWALLFVTLAYLKALDVLRKHQWLDWTWFTIFAVLAAYTHIYAFIAAGFLYLYILFELVRNKSDSRKNRIKKWVYSALLAGASYATWIFVIINQTKTISGDGYWIPPVTITSFVGYINFLFGRLSLIPVAVLAIYTWYLRRHKNMPKETVAGLFVPFATIMTGTVFSIILFPVFVPRYILPLVLCVCFAIVILIQKTERKDLQAILMIVILCTVFGNTILFSKQELIDAESDRMYQGICHFSMEDQIITDDWYLAKCIAAERKNVYYCGENPELRSRFDQELYKCINQRERTKVDREITNKVKYFLTFNENEEGTLIDTFQYDGSTVYLFSL